VSKPFPYSILYYTDESDDQGKALRKALASFEANYDVFDFSIDNYYDWIGAHLQLHQGTADDAVPVEWSGELVTRLESKGKHLTYYTYPGTDHNLRPSWDTVITRDLKFFATQLTSSADSSQ
jgi:dipeptidyl aminopeptidase/acylaminoacyl peptidase